METNGNTESVAVALATLKAAILAHVRSNPGIVLARPGRALRLETSWADGSASNYLTWAILGELVKAGRIRKDGRGYFAV